MRFFGIDLAFQDNSEGLVIEKSQYIDPQYIERLKREKDESKAVRERDYMRVASIPTSVVDKWLSEGFPFWEASAREIVAKLQMEGLDNFITTNKRV